MRGPRNPTRQQSVAVLLTIFSMALLLLAGCTSSEPEPDTVPENTRVTGLSDDEKELTAVHEKGRSVTTIDVAGLDINMDCAEKVVFEGDGKDLRVRLLRSGCARLKTDSPSPDEVAAQDSARADQVGVWSPALRAC